MKRLEDIASLVENCRRCPLGGSRTRAVPGEGPAPARVMFVGEAPGASEDRVGRPFCGAAGRVLDEMLAVAGLARREVFIANILKCRPPGNRNPEASEIAACTPWLEAQLEAVAPEVVCCLGNFASGWVLRRFGLGARVEGISRIHGRVFSAGDLFRATRIVPVFHPAAVTYDPGRKKDLAGDFLALRGCLDGDQGFSR